MRRRASVAAVEMLAAPAAPLAQEVDPVPTSQADDETSFGIEMEPRGAPRSHDTRFPKFVGPLVDRVAAPPVTVERDEQAAP